MTIQEIFDKVTTHLLTQRKQSKEGKVCLYRGPNGTMCAVGCLIKDEFYDGGLEQKLSTDIDVHAALEKSGIEVNEELEKFLRILQQLHDGDPVNIDAAKYRKFLTIEWAEGLQYIATEYNLKFNPPTPKSLRK
jgi:hypothetical protein